jgi:hypothetical protein
VRRKASAATPGTLGELNPGDKCTLPDTRRVRVTGHVDCGVFFRCEDSCSRGDGDEPHILPGETRVCGVVRRVWTGGASKVADSDPLRGGAAL